MVDIARIALMMRVVTVLLALVCIALAQPNVKRDFTRVNTASGSLFEIQTAIFPRAASFSDGRYVIVYTIRTANSNSRVYAQIFNADGSTTGAEFDVDQVASDVSVMSAPTVAVFPDDTFIIAYRWDTGSPTSIWAKRFAADGSPSTGNFRVDTDDGATVTRKGIELIGYADKSFAVVYNSVAAGCPNIVFRDSADALVTQYCGYTPTLPDTPLNTATILDSTGTLAYATNEMDRSYISQGVIADGSTSMNLYGPVDETRNPSNVAIALSGDSWVTVLYTLDQSIFYASSTSTFERFSTRILFGADGVTDYLDPAIISVNDTYVLITYKTRPTNGDPEQLKFQMAEIRSGESSIDLVLTTPPLIGPAGLRAASFAPLSGGDVLVVTKAPSDSGIYQQILTFCGNGFLELQEECDSTANCDSNCRCTNGLVGYNGVCGLPNVIPVLDCVKSTANEITLYFSFINEDRVEHVLEQGPQNSFSPAGLATNRPIGFNTGSTLTYPASPYVLTIPSGTAQITWLLGAYNLTVDLAANAAALQCPESPGFVMDVGTLGYLSGATIFAQNFATRYGVSVSRLSTEIVQTGGSVPSKKRADYPITWDVSVFVAPANATEVSEPSSEEVVRSVVEEFKNSTTQPDVKESLLEGYSDTGIKEITPTPTGVEVRGTRSDPSSVVPSAAPTASVTPPSGNTSQSNLISPCLTFVSAIALGTGFLV